MTEETASSIGIHASTCHIALILLPADISDFRISSLRMHEYKSADACVRCHCIAFCHLDTKSAASELVIVCMAMLVCMAVSLAAAAAIVTVHLSAFSKEFKDVLLDCVVRAA